MNNSWMKDLLLARVRLTPVYQATHTHNDIRNNGNTNLFIFDTPQQTHSESHHPNQRLEHSLICDTVHILWNFASYLGMTKLLNLDTIHNLYSYLKFLVFEVDLTQQHFSFTKIFLLSQPKNPLHSIFSFTYNKWANHLSFQTSAKQRQRFCRAENEVTQHAAFLTRM